LTRKNKPQTKDCSPDFGGVRGGDSKKKKNRLKSEFRRKYEYTEETRNVWGEKAAKLKNLTPKIQKKRNKKDKKKP